MNTQEFDDDLDDGFFDEDVVLQPTDPVTDDARRRMREAEAPPTFSPVEIPPAVPALPRFQFNIRHILMANVALAVLLTILQATAPQMVAGVLGVVAFGVLLGVNVYQPTQPQAYLLAWSLLGLYILIAVVALLQS